MNFHLVINPNPYDKQCVNKSSSDSGFFFLPSFPPSSSMHFLSDLLFNFLRHKQ